MARLRFRKYRIPEKAFVVGAHAFLVLFAAVCAFPFLNVSGKSFSPEFTIQHGQVLLRLVKSFGLINSLWALILPCAITTFNAIIVKNYFQTIPDSLEESAFIDGAWELTSPSKCTIPAAATTPFPVRSTRHRDHQPGVHFGWATEPV